MNRIRIILGLIILLMLSLFIGALFFTIYFPRPTTYSVHVKTEIVSVETVDQNGLGFDIPTSMIYFNTGDSLAVNEGYINVDGRVSMTIERVSKRLLLMSFEAKSSDQSVGSLVLADGKKFELSTYDVISIQNFDEQLLDKGAIVIPVYGQIKVGRNVGLSGALSDYGVLKSGEISMIGKSFLPNRYFEADKYNLLLGDEVIFENTSSEASGLVYIGDGDHLLVNYRIVAKTAWIKKPGAVDNETRFKISATLLNRFLKDQLFQTISLAIAFLIGLFSLAEFIRKAHQFLSNSNLINPKKKGL